MIRRSSILPFLKFDRFNNWRTSADNLLFNFLHLVGGSIKIYEPLVGYRSCADNAGSRNVLGNIRYNTNDAKKSYWDNKINLFKDIFWYLGKEKKLFMDTYSKKEYYKMLKEIYCSVPKVIKFKFFR